MVAKRRLNSTSKVNTQTKTHTDKHTDRQHMDKSTYKKHKIPSMVNQVTIGYCCSQLLYIQGWLLQDNTIRGDHVCLPHTVCQKWKPQIECMYLNLLHI